MSKGKIKNYVGKKIIKFISLLDLEVKRKSFVPGIGKYKDLEKGYNILSTAPTSIRRRRWIVFK